MSSEVINGLFALGGAIIGAIVSGVFAFYVAGWSRERRQLTVSTSHPSRLLMVHEKVGDKIEISIGGRAVKNVLLSEIYISNTGNKAIENLSFSCLGSGEFEVLSVEMINQLDDTAHAGARSEIKSGKCVEVAVDYINPGDELVVRSLLSGGTPHWQVPIRQPTLEVVHRQSPVGTYSDVAARMLFEAIQRNFILHPYFKAIYPPYRRYLEDRSRRSREDD